MTKKLTDAEWDSAFANMEASDWPETSKEYCRRAWGFLRNDGKIIRDMRAIFRAARERRADA